MGRDVKVAIVGVGGIVLNQHLKHLAAMPNVKIAGYLRNKSGRAEAAAKDYGGRLYDSVDQVAADDGVDAVYVSVPPFAHGEIELKLLAAKKALFIEKPLAIDLPTAERIHNAAIAAGVVTAVGYHWRYQTTVDRMRECLAGKEILGGVGFWCGDRPGVWWWRDKSTSGGQAVEQTTHIFDLANYLVESKPVSVYATGRRSSLYAADPKHSVEDVSTAQVQYANGVTLSIWSSDVMNGKASKVGLEIFAVGGRYEVGFEKLNCRERDEVVEVSNEGNPYQRLNDAFIHALATGDRSRIRSDYASAMLAHRVTTGVERSIASGSVEKL